MLNMLLCLKPTADAQPRHRKRDVSTPQTPRDDGFVATPIRAKRDAGTNEAASAAASPPVVSKENSGREGDSGGCTMR